MRKRENLKENSYNAFKMREMKIRNNNQKHTQNLYTDKSKDRKNYKKNRIINNKKKHHTREADKL